MQLPLQIADHNRAAVEHAGRESRIHAGLSKHRAEVLDGARTPGGHQRHLADLPHPAQLLDVITATHAIAPHAIEDDLARAAPLRLADPCEHVASRFARALRVAGELVGPVAVLGELTVDADHDTLGAEAGAEGIDETRGGERWRVDGDLFRARIQDFLRVRHAANAAGDTERNIQNARYPAHPLAIDAAAFGARGDVIEDQLVRALVAISRRELHDIAHDPVVDRKSTRLNSSHVSISYAVFCLKKKSLTAFLSSPESDESKRLS